MRMGLMGRKVLSGFVRVSFDVSVDVEGGRADVVLVMADEITNTMRNCGARTIDELKPEMVGPAGPWVGQNRPNWVPKP